MTRPGAHWAGLRSGLAALRRSSLARSSAGLGGLTVAEMALGLVVAVLLARELGAEGLGIYSLAIAAVTLAGLPVEFGLPRLVMREIAHAEPASPEAKGVLLFAATVIGLISVIIVPLVFFVGQSPWTGLGDTTRAILPAAALLIPFSALGRAFSGALGGRHRVARGAMPQRLVRPGAMALALAVLVAIEPGWLTPVRAVYLHLGASVLALGVGLTQFLFLFTDTLRGPRAVIMWRTWLAAMLRLGIANGLKRVEPQLLLLLTAALASTEAVGLLRVAQRGTEVVAASSATVITASAPRIASLYAGGERARLQHLVTLVARISLGISLAGLAFFVVAGPWLIDTLFGTDFASAWGAMIILTVGLSMRTLCGPGPMVTSMLRREDVMMLGFAVSLGVSVGLAALLIAPLGVAGAACAAAAGEIAMAVLLWRRTLRDLGVHPSAFGARSLAR